MKDPATVRRQALGTAGLMAYGRKDYAKAAAMHEQQVREAKSAGEPTEVVLALYNLGNTYIAAERYDEAVETLNHAADGCCYHKLVQVAPFVFTNLGVALYRSGAKDDAYDNFKVARDIFQAQQNLPAEAHVCDCLALCYHDDGQRDEAEKAWHFALSLYDNVTNPSMKDVREGGRNDILTKLREFGYGAPG